MAQSRGLKAAQMFCSVKVLLVIAVILYYHDSQLGFNVPAHTFGLGVAGGHEK
ncbi:MAG: hypothetical protein HS114_00485 [Anaerolineales bacterium]|nr:hypothetical protein [Anaerolineales bacterium]